MPLQQPPRVVDVVEVVDVRVDEVVLLRVVEVVLLRVVEVVLPKVVDVVLPRVVLVLLLRVVEVVPPKVVDVVLPRVVLVVLLVVLGRAPPSSAFPGKLKAVGPGRSAAESGSGSIVGSRHPAATSVDACGRPSARQPACEPVRVIVRTRPPPGPNAPFVRCSQLSRGSPAQSELSTHDLGPAHGKPPQWEVLPHAAPLFPPPTHNPKPPVVSASRQKPQKTRVCVPDGAAVAVATPVVNIVPAATVPMLSIGLGGQS